MRFDYEMTGKDPCPSCRGAHMFTAADGVPPWDPMVGAVFRVTCPMTGAVVEVVVSPQGQPTALSPATTVGSMTDVRCPVCHKANFKVAREGMSNSTVVVQYLECSNEGCQYEMMRRWNRFANVAIPDPV